MKEILQKLLQDIQIGVTDYHLSDLFTAVEEDAAVIPSTTLNISGMNFTPDGLAIGIPGGFGLKIAKTSITEARFNHIVRYFKKGYEPENIKVSSKKPKFILTAIQSSSASLLNASDLFNALKTLAVEVDTRLIDSDSTFKLDLKSERHAKVKISSVETDVDEHTLKARIVYRTIANIVISAENLAALELKARGHRVTQKKAQRVNIGAKTYLKAYQEMFKKYLPNEYDYLDISILKVAGTITKHEYFMKENHIKVNSYIDYGNTASINKAYKDFINKHKTLINSKQFLSTDKNIIKYYIITSHLISRYNIKAPAFNFLFDTVDYKEFINNPKYTGFKAKAREVVKAFKLITSTYGVK
jgi:hypothetical protein